jgi:hypothetical protein
MQKHGLIGCAGALAMFLLPSVAQAEPISLTVNTTTSIQQTENSPCVIGDPSCQNPDGFDFTLLDPQLESGSASSPTYTVEQIRDIVGGDSFVVGIDVNQAAGLSAGVYTLQSFNMSVDGSALFATSGLTTISPINNGNGFSDALLLGFDLTGLAPTATVVFNAAFSGGTAGREQFFLGGSTEAVPTPEPTSILLVASGLAAAYAGYRRKTSV